MDDKRDIPVLTLTEMLNQYLMVSFNETRKYYANYLTVAKWAWKDLLWNTLWQTKHKYVAVDKTSTPYSIPKPKDMIRLFHVSVEDECKNLQAFSTNEYMSTLQKPKQKEQCSCHVGCGCEDALCKAIDSISVRTKDVWIDDVLYTEKIWNKRCDNGDFIEIKETPIKDFTLGHLVMLDHGSTWQDTSYTIKIDVQEKFICKLEVNSCGCVLPTEKNKTLIINCCGCFFTDCLPSTCSTGVSITNNKHGKIKVVGDRIFMDTDADWVIVSYQTNGDCPGEEILIPEIAVPTLWSGMDHYSTAHRPNIPRSEKEGVKRAYKSMKLELSEFLNPIIVEEFVKAQQGFAKW